MYLEESHCDFCGQVHRTMVGTPAREFLPLNQLIMLSSLCSPRSDVNGLLTAKVSTSVESPPRATPEASAMSRRVFVLRGGWISWMLLLLASTTRGSRTTTSAFSATSRVKRQQRGLAQVGRTTATDTTTRPLPIPTTDHSAKSQTSKATDDDEEEEDSVDRELLWSLAGKTSRRKRKRGLTPSIQLLPRKENEGEEEQLQDEHGNFVPGPITKTTTSATRTKSSGGDDSLYTNNQVQPQDIQGIELICKKVSEDEELQQRKSEVGKGTEVWWANVTLMNGTNQSISSLLLNPQRLHQRNDNAIWMATRAMVNVTASELGAIVGNSVFTTRYQLACKKVGSAGLVLDASAIDILNSTKDNSTTIDYNATMSTNATTPTIIRTFVGNQKACDWGIRMEPKALKQYIQVTGNKVTETGLHIRRFPAGAASEDMDHATDTAAAAARLLLIGASPDGLVMEKNNGKGNNNNKNNNNRVGLLEIKCLWGRRHKKELPQFDHCPTRFYDQIQGQLAVCDLDFCDLMMYIPPTGSGSSRSSTKSKRKQQGKNYCILRIARDETYWKETLLPSVQSFCAEVEELKRTGSSSSPPPSSLA